MGIHGVVVRRFSAEVAVFALLGDEPVDGLVDDRGVLPLVLRVAGSEEAEEGHSRQTGIGFGSAAATIVPVGILGLETAAVLRRIPETFRLLVLRQPEEGQFDGFFGGLGAAVFDGRLQPLLQPPELIGFGGILRAGRGLDRVRRADDFWRDDFG